MLTCKQVSKSLDKQDYHDLTPFKRFMLKLHVALCVVCRRYNKQVMLMQDTCRHFRDQNNDQGGCCGSNLSDEQKSDMNELLKKELRQR